MLTLRFGETYGEPCTLVLGGFDGLHIGHRALLAAAKKEGFPLAVTAVFGRGSELFTLPEREYLFARAGVSLLYALPFTEGFRTSPPERFLSELFSFLSPKRIVCGEDFRFGKDASGTPELLQRLAPCPVHILPIVRKKGGEPASRKISTSECKSMLQGGELSRLNGLLVPDRADFFEGAYFVQGEVEHGREVGRTYGFPTLNITAPPEKLLPPDGVYGGVCTTPKGTYPTIVNIGARPTFGVEERKIEAYLDGFSGDLYGETVRIFPTEFFRGIAKFSSKEELKAQLTSDIARLRENRR